MTTTVNIHPSVNEQWKRQPVTITALASRYESGAFCIQFLINTGKDNHDLTVFGSGCEYEQWQRAVAAFNAAMSEPVPQSVAAE